ncbi:hypothetical protein [Nonomuraea sp. 10N515B]|uniref:hypothetical protein n=1 Tax=Nonomuraea sp. 10N515B TaxID=3457422 RepID=UPI003FCD82EC
MRSVFVFPAGERAETVTSLDRHLPQQRDPWTLAGNLYINIDDEQTGCLFSDWDPDAVTVLEATMDTTPPGQCRSTSPGGSTARRRSTKWSRCCLSTEAWPLTTTPPTLGLCRKIESGVVIDGLRFFDFHTYHELHREH